MAQPRSRQTRGVSASRMASVPVGSANRSEPPRLRMLATKSLRCTTSGVSIVRRLARSQSCTVPSALEVASVPPVEGEACVEDPLTVAADPRAGGLPVLRRDERAGAVVQADEQQPTVGRGRDGARHLVERRLADQPSGGDVAHLDAAPPRSTTRVVTARSRRASQSSAASAAACSNLRTRSAASWRSNCNQARYAPSRN